MRIFRLIYYCFCRRDGFSRRTARQGRHDGRRAQDYRLSSGCALFVGFGCGVKHARELSREDRWLVRAWVVLFVVMFFNASVSGIIRLHLAVICLSVVALLHIRRAGKVTQVAAYDKELA